MAARLRQVEIDGRALPLTIRRSPLAKRISLRIAPSGDALILVLPSRAKEEQGLRFVRDQAVWIATKLAVKPPRVDFAPGALIPLLGTDHQLTHAPEARRGVWAEDGLIHVSGQEEHFSRRLTDWLRREAKAAITARAFPMAERIDRRISAISVKDTSSRWGSCSASGNLSFSWRLILAPEPVLTYVVAHEVAHLAEMNHSAAFWSVVGQLCPDFAAQRRWLKRHGAALHRFG